MQKRGRKRNTMAKSVIILGTGGSLHFCDFNYTKDGKILNSEIWGVNGAYTAVNVMPAEHRSKFSMDKLFMGDTLFSHEQGSLNFDIDRMNKFAAEYHCQMYSLHEMRLGKHVLKATRYPYKRIVEYFHTDYFTDSVCYILAYLLYSHTYLAKSPQGVVRPELKQPLKIRFFGIDMSTNREYNQSKGGVEYWLGLAWALGCTFENSPGSAILMNPNGVPYGKWDKLKAQFKAADPFGLMKGKKAPTDAEADQLMEKMKADLRPGIKEPRL